MNKPARNGNDGMANLPKSLQFLFTIIMAPIMEEIIYRFGFDKTWHSTLKMIRSRILGENERKKIEDDDDINNQKHPPSKTRLWFGHRPWILVSSICFGLIHLSNHLPLNPETIHSAATIAAGKNENYSFEFCTALTSSYLLLRGAIFQMVYTTYIALTIFGPLYCKRGIGASIGAHIMFNINGIVLSKSIFYRLLIRLFLKILSSTFGTKVRFIDRFRKENEPSLSLVLLLSLLLSSTSFLFLLIGSPFAIS